MMHLPSKRMLILLFVVALLTPFAAPASKNLAGGTGERFTNGNFESGFGPTGAGIGWTAFTNGGQADYGWHDDTWAPVVWDGQHSQLLEIHTYGRAASDPDRFIGIYQTVAVVPGTNYTFALHGIMRADPGGPDVPDVASYGYRVQWGYDPSGGSDANAVTNWTDVGWNSVYPRISPGSIESFSTNLTTTSNRITVFIRALKKWPRADVEFNVNLDAVSLVGAVPEDTQSPTVAIVAPTYPQAGRASTVHVTASNDVGITEVRLLDNGALVDSRTYAVGMLNFAGDFSWTPAANGLHTLQVEAKDVGGKTAVRTVVVTVGEVGEFIFNAGFEESFSAGGVATGWTPFDSGGHAHYGWYDETWDKVIYNGAHSQLIEINTFGFSGSESDRYAGIYQTVSGLVPGATYQLSMHGMLRAREDDPDRDNFSYRAQWGYDANGGTDWRAVTNWTELPWNKVYPRLSPRGSMDSYTTTFVAPSSQITLFIRSWKKWGTAYRELDFNIDAVSLTGYR